MVVKNKVPAVFDPARYGSVVEWQKAYFQQYQAENNPDYAAAASPQVPMVYDSTRYTNQVSWLSDVAEELQRQNQARIAAAQKPQQKPQPPPAPPPKAPERPPPAAAPQPKAAQPRAPARAPAPAQRPAPAPTPGPVPAERPEPDLALDDFFEGLDDVLDSLSDSITASDVPPAPDKEEALDDLEQRGISATPSGLVVDTTVLEELPLPESPSLAVSARSLEEAVSEAARRETREARPYRQIQEAMTSAFGIPKVRSFEGPLALSEYGRPGPSTDLGDFTLLAGSRGPSFEDVILYLTLGNLLRGLTGRAVRHPEIVQLRQSALGPHRGPRDGPLTRLAGLRDPRQVAPLTRLPGLMVEAMRARPSRRFLTHLSWMQPDGGAVDPWLLEASRAGGRAALGRWGATPLGSAVARAPVLSRPASSRLLALLDFLDTAEALARAGLAQIRCATC